MPACAAFGVKSSISVASAFGRSSLAEPPQALSSAAAASSAARVAKRGKIRRIGRASIGRVAAGRRAGGALRGGGRLDEVHDPYLLDLRFATLLRLALQDKLDGALSP